MGCPECPGHQKQKQETHESVLPLWNEIKNKKLRCRFPHYLLSGGGERNEKKGENI